MSIPDNRNFGFIIIRHVNSEVTNNYWNSCVINIRRFYPLKKIVVIDDNSNQDFLKQKYEYKNIEYINSEFPGRGELLPYYYFFKNHFFDNAIIIHDSIFIQKRINFESLIKKQIKVIPLWHFTCEKNENSNNTLRLISVLNNGYEIYNTFTVDKSFETMMDRKNKNIWSGCFGIQSFINRDFLIGLRNKYHLFNLLNVVQCRLDRCCLERIIGMIFYTEYIKHLKIPSLFGDIKTYFEWGYTYNQYIEDIKNKKIPNIPFVKVWTGR
jgi:hypothetical protein